MYTWFIWNWWASYGVNRGIVTSISIKVEWKGICCISGFVSWRIYIGVGLSEINWYDMLLVAHLPKRDLSNFFKWNIQREMSLRLPLAWITVLFHLQVSLTLWYIIKLNIIRMRVTLKKDCISSKLYTMNGYGQVGLHGIFPKGNCLGSHTIGVN